MKATIVEKYYSVPELASLLSCSSKTVRRKIKAGAFGSGVVNIGSEGSGANYRVPASGVHGFLGIALDSKEGLDLGLGIVARSVGELRRKAQAA